MYYTPFPKIREVKIAGTTFGREFGRDLTLLNGLKGVSKGLKMAE
jgi:hypothetical protein